MRRITIYDWDTGFQKIRFTTLLREEFGYGLLRAKSATDAVLDHQPLNLVIADEKTEQVIFELNQLGAKFELDGAGVTD